MSERRMYYSSEAEQRAQQQRTALAFTMLAIGLGIGGILALLFAPSKGENIRQSIGDAVNQAYEDGREATSKSVEGLQRDLAQLRKDFEDRIQA